MEENSIDLKTTTTMAVVSDNHDNTNLVTKAREEGELSSSPDVDDAEVFFFSKL